MKRKELAVLVACGAITVWTAAAIIYFSGQDSGQSNGLSTEIAAQLLALLCVERTAENLALMNLILRKLAHFSAYTLLGFGLTGVVRRQKRIPSALAAILLGGIFAMTDEFHQSFSPGRSPSLWDVALDTCGVAAGWTAFQCLSGLRERISAES